ncbi:MAG: fimbrillin family protein [Bacteroidales bacterium]|jgi:hypothetical protein|nr:fimbrillin family protein [Bacteroidales bacterium]
MLKTQISLVLLFSILLSVSSCSKDDKDIAIQADMELSGQLRTYSHGTNGWLEGDIAGVFVTSDGNPQNNLKYTPQKHVEYTQNKWGGYDASDVYDVSLIAADEKAGFKRGEHSVYAYVPYSEDVSDLHSVPVPDIATQLGPETMSFQPRSCYDFSEKDTTFSDIPLGNLSLGEFNPMFSQVTAVLQFPEELDGKYFSELTVSCDSPIAYSNGLMDLETKKFSGDPVYSIKYKLIEPEQLSVLKFGDNVMLPSKTCFIMIAVHPEDMGNNIHLTFSTMIDGIKYSSTCTEYGRMSEEDITDNNFAARDGLPVLSAE